MFGYPDQKRKISVEDIGQGIEDLKKSKDSSEMRDEMSEDAKSMFM